MALTLTEIEAITLDCWEKGSLDMYFLGNIMMYRLLKKGKKYPGGKAIRVTIGYGQPLGGAFSSQSTFFTGKVEEFNAAFFTKAMYYEPVTYDIDDETENSGPQAEIKLIAEKLTLAQTKIRYSMAYDFYNSSTYGATGRSILGLPAMISTATYGQISPSDILEWQPNTSGGIVTTAEPITGAVMRKMRTACMVGDEAKDEPSIMLTTRILKDQIEDQTQAAKRYENTELAEIGFKNLVIDGIPLVADYQCPSGYLYALNENYCDFMSHSSFFFKRRPWQSPADKPIYTTQIIWCGQFICKRRNAHGSHSNLY
jgi:hypothetical protein